MKEIPGKIACILLVGIMLVMIAGKGMLILIETPWEVK